MHWIRWSNFGWKVYESVCIEFGYWKHISTNFLRTDPTMNRSIPFNPETSMRIRSRKKSEFSRTSETIYLITTHTDFARSNSRSGCLIMLNQFTIVHYILEIISRFSKKRETNWCRLVSPLLIYIIVKLCHWDEYTIYLI